MPPKRAPLEYTALDTEMQSQILTERLRQIEAEHFNHVTNKAVIASQPLGDEEAKKNALALTDKAMGELEAAHRTIAAQLEALK